MARLRIVREASNLSRFENSTINTKMTEATVQEYAGGPVELYEELTEIERRFEEVEVDLRMLIGVFIVAYYHNFIALPPIVSIS